MGENVERVTRLSWEETVRLDTDRLGLLYEELGESGAENAVCRALEDLATRLGLVERCWTARDFEECFRASRSVAAIAEQIGMATLARVARDVGVTIDAGDAVALSAVMTRLLRIGDCSLNELWDMQDLSL
ncbi:hypothetical protein ACM25N_07400 [Roseovarius sp. C7]|uniref:hypothetical protein n=1 Tax=Roseovarius sp. C7 TaxID=3398643 RepID=UPI0039F64A0F